MKKYLFLLIILISAYFAQAQYQPINNGESGLSVRTKLNTMHNQLYNLHLTAQFSTDGSTWHGDYAVGDYYMRLSSDLGTTWTEKVLIFDGINILDSLDMNNARIKNLATAIDATDAINLQQLNDSLAVNTPYDSLRYRTDGYLKTYVADVVLDSVLLDDTNLRVRNDGSVSHLGTIEEHFAHISPPYIALGGDITDNLDGTITIDSCEAWVKTTNSIDSKFIAVSVPDTTLTIAANQNIVLYIDYNSGSPRYTQRVSTAGYFYQNWDETPFATVINIGSKIIVNPFVNTTTNGIYKSVLGQLNYQPIRYLGGLATAETGTRQLNVSAGALLQAYDYEGISGLNTSSGGTFTRMYVTSGVWTRTTGETTVSNSQYNDIATGLATLTASPERWANKWLYYIVDNPSFWILIEGQTAYTSLASAQAGGIPSVLPPEVSSFYAGSILVAKITVSGNQTNIVSIQNPFTTVFQTSAAASHNNLSDLQAAGSGVTYGHINTSAQTLYGAKTFDSSPLVPTVAITDSTTKAASTAFVLEKVANSVSSYTDEKAQDAVGGILDDGTIGDIVFNYNDATPKISATVEDDSHNHIISNIDALQDSLNTKQKTITGAASTVTTSNLSGNMALVSNSSGKIATSTLISEAELNLLDGLTGGFVMANSTFGLDNRILRSDGAARYSQSSSATIDDSGNAVFSGTVSTSVAPTSGSHLTNKDYVDALAVSGVKVFAENGLKRRVSNDTIYIGLNDSIHTLTGTNDTLDLNVAMHGYHVMGSSVDTIYIDNLFNGATGNIEIATRAADDSIRFRSAHTFKFNPNLNVVSGAIPVTNSATGKDVYSYWFSGNNVYINGTKDYE